MIENNVKELKDRLNNERPSQWSDIPDIDLYMDQVLNYMQRQHIGLNFDETLTSAMVNNYIKKSVLPRAKGKRYERGHIAYLTAVCLLKQVLSVDSTKELLDSHLGEANIENTENIHQFYDKYCSVLDKEYNSVATKLDDSLDKDAIAELALELTISSYAQKLVAERLLDIIK